MSSTDGDSIAALRQQDLGSPCPSEGRSCLSIPRPGGPAPGGPAGRHERGDRLRRWCAVGGRRQGTVTSVDPDSGDAGKPIEVGESCRTARSSAVRSRSTRTRSGSPLDDEAVVSVDPGSEKIDATIPLPDGIEGDLAGDNFRSGPSTRRASSCRSTPRRTRQAARRSRPVPRAPTRSPWAAGRSG